MFSLKDRHKSSATAANSPSSSTLSNRTSYMKSTTSSLDYSMLPKKIIRATLSYTAQHQHELSFEKGDFFHVVGRENDHHWFAVNNPLTNLTGLVPVSYFEIVDKTARTMNAIQPVLPLDHHQPGNRQDMSNQRSSLQPQQQHCYGVVLYDFVAERPDELNCKANEAIIVIAQSNKEWFVAKPIGRLGGPGLIPVSFVQLHDVITDNPVLLPTTNATSSSSETTTASTSPRASVTIPKLEDWKKRTQKYEASSILLVGDAPSSTTDDHQKTILSSKPGASTGRFSLSSSMANSLSDQYHKYSASRRQSKLQQLALAPIDQISPSSTMQQQQQQQQQQQYRYSYESSTPPRRRNSEFIVVKDRKSTQLHHPTSFSPTLPTTLLDNTTTGHATKGVVVDIAVTSFVLQEGKYWFILYATINNGKHSILRRTYECFYRCHVRLLQDFPEEAGKGEKKRILPFMPGPLEEVDDYITEQRREDLDLYCKTLLSLPTYLSACDIVQTELFGLKNGDSETDNAPTKMTSDLIHPTDITNGEPLPTTSTGHFPTTKSVPGFSDPGGDGIIINNNKYSTDNMYYNSGAGKVKIKIVHKDDIFAVKIPADCTLQELELRVMDRLGGSVLGKMKYKDDVHHPDATYLPLESELDMEEAFILAIQRGKLTIVVD